MGRLSQDHLLPYMCSEKHYKDTWFIVCEEDFRLKMEHDVSIDHLVPEPFAGTDLETGLQRRREKLEHSRMAAAEWTEQERRTARRLSTAPLAGPHRHDADFPLPSSKAQDPQSLSPGVLEDLVYLGLLAEEHGHGDLVWYSWVHGVRKSHPGHGSTMLGLTAEAAKLILRKTWTWAPGHYDLLLLEALKHDVDFRRSIGCGYVYPPIGHFATHQSGCELVHGQPWIREASGWKNCSQSTRHEWQQLCRFTAKGMEAVCQVEWVERAWTSFWTRAAWKEYHVLLEQSQNEREKRQFRLLQKHLDLRYWATSLSEVPLLPWPGSHHFHRSVTSRPHRTFSHCQSPAP